MDLDAPGMRVASIDTAVPFRMHWKNRFCPKHRCAELWGVGGLVIVPAPG